MYSIIIVRNKYASDYIELMKISQSSGLPSILKTFLYNLFRMDVMACLVCEVIYAIWVGGTPVFMSRQTCISIVFIG